MLSVVVVVVEPSQTRNAGFAGNHGEMTEDLTPKTEIQYSRIGNKSAWEIFSG